MVNLVNHWSLRAVVGVTNSSLYVPRVEVCTYQNDDLRSCEVDPLLQPLGPPVRHSGRNGRYGGRGVDVTGRLKRPLHDLSGQNTEKLF